LSILLALGAVLCACTNFSTAPAKRRSPVSAALEPSPVATLGHVATTAWPSRTPEAPATPRAQPSRAVVPLPTPARSPYIWKVPLAGVQVKTYAGSTIGSRLGNRLAAQLITPMALARAADGNLVVSDFLRILKIDKAGEVTAFMTKVQPGDFVFDAAGDLIVAERYHVVAKYTKDGKRIVLAGSTNYERGFADGLTTDARFDSLRGLAYDRAGNLYLADGRNHKIRKIDTKGYVTTIAGTTPGFADGYGHEAAFNEPMDVAVDSKGNVFVADSLNGKIRKITPGGIVSTYAQVGYCSKIEIDRNDKMYVVADEKIYAVPDPTNIVLLAGTDTRGVTDGPSSTATLLAPGHLFIDDDGTIYFPDVSNNTDGQPSLIRTLTSIPSTLPTPPN
jgi:hypothetical protein